MRTYHWIVAAFLAVGAVFCFAHIASASTVVSGTIDADTVWSSDAGPYIVSGGNPLVVASGVTLTINPGTVVKFDTPGGGIDVYGSLSVNGTDGNPVYFTHTSDDTVGGETGVSGSSPNANAWGTIRLWHDSSANFSDAEIRYATVAVEATDATISYDHVTVSNSGYPVQITRGSFSVSDSVFTGNEYPADIDINTILTHHGNTVTGTKWYKDAFYIRNVAGDRDQVTLSGGDVPYLFLSDKIVASSIHTLIIEPGAEIYQHHPDIPGNISKNLSFATGQTLIAHGTADAPIVFHNIAFWASGGAVLDISHARFDMQGSDAALSAVNDGRIMVEDATLSGGSVGVSVSNGAYARISRSNFSDVDKGLVAFLNGSFEMDHVHIDRAEVGIGFYGRGYGTTTNIVVKDSTVGIDSSNFYGGSNRMYMRDGVIADNQIGFVLNNLYMDVHFNDFHGNDIGAREYVTSIGPFDMENNWWGDASGPKNEQLNPEGTGDAVLEDIDFIPWLGQAPGSESTGGDPAPDPVPVPDPDPTPSPEPDPLPTPEPDPQPGPVSSPRIPIVLVPGIMGSEISKGYGDYGEIWPDAGTLITSISDEHLSDLAMRADGTPDPAKPMVVGDILRSIDPPVGSETHVFDVLISRLELAGYREGVDLFVFPYDWRLPIEQSADTFKTEVESILSATGRSRLMVVAHSMGGLVAKSYLSSYGDASIESLVMIGVPNLGAAKAQKALLYGDDMGIHAGPIHLLNQERVKEISANMPSLYELLPSGGYADSSGSLFDAYRAKDRTVLGMNHGSDIAYLVANGKNQPLIEAADRLHENIDQYQPSHAAVYDVVGCSIHAFGKMTLGGIIPTKKFLLGALGKKFSPDFRLIYTQGDGTVPLFSAASIESVQTAYVHNVAHADLPSAAGLGDYIASIASGAPSLIDGGDISVSEYACAPKSFVSIHAHGPVRLMLQNLTTGDILGEDIAGSVFKTVYGGSYDRVGDASYITFLADMYDDSDAPYKISLTAVGTGAFNVVLDKYQYAPVERENVGMEAFYDVPVHSVGDTYEFQLSSRGTFDYQLRGVSGDIPREQVESSVVLYGDASDDIVPPHSSAEIVSSGALLFHADDDLSGVYKVEYSTDGGSSWTSVFNLENPVLVGDASVEYFSVDKAGNVEDITHSIDVGSAQDSGDEGGGDTGGNGGGDTGGTDTDNGTTDDETSGGSSGSDSTTGGGSGGGSGQGGGTAGDTGDDPLLRKNPFIVPNPTPIQPPLDKPVAEPSVFAADDIVDEQVSGDPVNTPSDWEAPLEAPVLELGASALRSGYRIAPWVWFILLLILMLIGLIARHVTRRKTNSSAGERRDGA